MNEIFYKEIEEHTDRIINPKTEVDYLYALNYWIHFVMFIATLEYRTGWAGIIETGTKVDFDEVENKLTPQLLDSVSKLVTIICNRFDVARPGQNEIQGKQSFREWYERTSKEAGSEKEYPDFIFSRIIE